MGWAGLDLWSSPTFVLWTPTPSRLGRKTKRQVPTGFFKALQGGEPLRRLSPRVCVRCRRRPGSASTGGPSGRPTPGLRTDLPHWREEETICQVGEGQPLQLPSRPATTPRPCPNKGPRQPLKQLSRRDAGVQTAQPGGLAAKVRLNPRRRNPGNTRAAAPGPCSCPAETGRGAHSAERPLLCHHPERAALSSRVSL